MYGAPLDSQHPLRLAWNASLRGHVLAILQSHQIQHTEVQPLRRKSARLDRLEADTILVLAEKRNMNDSWFLAAVEIRKICIEQGLMNVSVELADPRGLQSTLTHRVEAEEPIHSVWPLLESRITHILGDKDWLALELLRRGTSYSPRENPVTVAITIHESSQADWIDIREKSSVCWTTVTTSRWRWKSLGESCGEGEVTKLACLSIVNGRTWPTRVEASVLVDRKSAREAWVITFSYSSRTATIGK